MPEGTVHSAIHTKLKELANRPVDAVSPHTGVETRPSHDLSPTEARRRNRKYIAEFLPPIIQTLMERGSDSATSIAEPLIEDSLDTFVTYAIDPGSAQANEFQGEVAEPVEMLSRASFVSYILRDREKRKATKTTQEEKDAVDSQYVFRIFDVKDARAADLARDNDDNSSYDVIANKIALRVNQLTHEINTIFREHGIDATVVACRYGGDEFGFACAGDIDPTLRNLVYSVVSGINETGADDAQFTNGITSITGYFNRGETSFAEESIQLKSGLKEIHAPTEGDKKKIFWKQFNIGLILDEKEIEDIQNLGIGVEDDSESVEALPLTAERYAEMMRTLGEQHEELVPMIGYIDKLIAQQPDRADQIRQEFVDYIKEVMYDRLLGEKVTTLQDFTEHFSEGKFDELYIYDMKGIKEINDQMSIATGDQAIVALWKGISSALGDEASKCMVFRRGSTFIVGLRSGVSLADGGAKQRLESLQSVQFERQEFAIGYHHVDVRGKTFTKDKQGRRELRAFMNGPFRAVDVDCTTKNIENHLLKHPSILEPRVVEKGRMFTVPESIQLFYNGKRPTERYKALILATEKMATIAQTQGDSEKYQKAIVLAKKATRLLVNAVLPAKIEEEKDPGKKLQMQNERNALLADAQYQHYLDVEADNPPQI